MERLGYPDLMHDRDLLILFNFDQLEHGVILAVLAVLVYLEEVRLVQCTIFCVINNSARNGNDVLDYL